MDRFDGGKDAAGRRFLEAIGKLPSWREAKEPGPVANPQGMFVCSPDGELLGWLTSAGIADTGKAVKWGPDTIQQMMERALKKWGKTPVKKEAATEKRPWTAEKNFLASHHAAHPVVLRFTSRDLPRPADQTDKKTHWGDDYFRREWNLNYAGFTHQEMRQFLPPKLEKGARAEVPASLVRRLARDYLIDNVHGTAPRFRDEDVKESVLTAEVVAVQDGRASVHLAGRTRTSNGPFGYEAKLLGRVTYDLKRQKVTGFELVAVGSRWGAVHHSGRGPWKGNAPDVGPAPMGLVAVLVETK